MCVWYVCKRRHSPFSLHTPIKQYSLFIPHAPFSLHPPIYQYSPVTPHPPFSPHPPFIRPHIILRALFIIQLFVCERSPSNHNGPLIIKLTSILYFPSTFMHYPPLSPHAPLCLSPHAPFSLHLPYISYFHVSLIHLLVLIHPLAFIHPSFVFHLLIPIHPLAVIHPSVPIHFIPHQVIIHL